MSEKTCALCKRSLKTQITPHKLAVNGELVEVCGDADGCRRTALAEYAKLKRSGATRSETPSTRQELLADAALDHLKTMPEYDGEKLMIFLDGKTVGAIGISGYDDDTEAVVSLFMHMRAMFEAQGKELALFPIPEVGQG